MVLGYHVIITAYGFWLPNAPRGSWSDFVGAWELFRFGGRATKVDTTESLARAPHDRAKRLATKRLLKYPPVTFTGRQALLIAKGFARATRESDYHCYACSILPQHVHLVLGRTERDIRRVAGHLKARATQELLDSTLHPFQHITPPGGSPPSGWAGKSWDVFIDSPEYIHAAIRYVERNCIKEGLREQHWSFVKRGPQLEPTRMQSLVES